MNVYRVVWRDHRPSTTITASRCSCPGAGRAVVFTDNLDSSVCIVPLEAISLIRRLYEDDNTQA